MCNVVFSVVYKTLTAEGENQWQDPLSFQTSIVSTFFHQNPRVTHVILLSLHRGHLNTESNEPILNSSLRCSSVARVVEHGQYG